jgi:hypothetical protein
VGKVPDANASGGVPTNDVNILALVGTAPKGAFAHPTVAYNPAASSRNACTALNSSSRFFSMMML